MSGYQLLPNLTGDEMDSLRESIRARGVQIPVEVDEDGAILDGHHRAFIADELGIDYPTIVRAGLSEPEKLEHIFELNIARRNMSGHDRTAVIGQCRERGMSLRAISRALKVSDRTVRRDVSAAFAAPDISPPEPEPPYRPLPTLPTRADRIAELVAEGRTMREIGDEIGLDNGTVSRIARGVRGQAATAPVAWPATRAFIEELAGFSAADPRQVAATVPERNRSATAKRLRVLGTFLGSIALELERSEANGSNR